MVSFLTASLVCITVNVVRLAALVVCLAVLLTRTTATVSIPAVSHVVPSVKMMRIEVNVVGQTAQVRSGTA